MRPSAAVRVAILAWLLGAVQALCAERAETFGVWVAPSTLKVFRDDRTRTPAPLQIELDCVRGETEAAQIVVHALRPLPAVRCSVTRLESAGGPTLPAQSVRLLLPRYLYLRYPSGNWDSRARHWPDPLPPAATFSVEAGANQPVWVSVRVPPEAQPGLYRGVAIVDAGSAGRAEVPVSVRVRDVALGPERHFRASFGVWWPGIRRRFDLKPGTAEEKRALDRFLRILLDSRISPLDLPWPIFDPRGAQVAQGPGVNAFRVPWPYGDRPVEETVAQLRSLGVAGKTYFYLRDEPRFSQFEEVRQVAARAQQAAPEIPRLCTIPPLQELTGAVTRWCVQPEEAYLHEQPLAERLRAGDEVWWYMMAVPRSPYPTLLLDDLALAPRALLWGAAKEGVTGLLYINTIYWGWDGRDEWRESLITMPALRNNMDGLLMYSRAAKTGPYPVSSIRLECIRDAIEDWELLRQLERRVTAALQGYAPEPESAARAHVVRLVAPVMADLRNWTHSPTVFAQARARLLDELEVITRAPAGWRVEYFPPVSPPAQPPRALITDEKSLLATAASAPPTLDGTLQEQCWQQAWAARDHRVAARFLNLYGLPWPEVATRVAAVHDGGGLWFAWQCQDQSEPQPSDYIELSLSSKPDREPLVLRLCYDGRRMAQRASTAASVYWRGRVARTDYGWSAEVRVPWRALGLPSQSSPPRLWVNLFRYRHAGRESLWWAARYGSRPNWTQLGALHLASD